MIKFYRIRSRTENYVLLSSKLVKYGLKKFEVLISVSESRWNCTLWNVIMKSCSHYTVSWQIIQYQKFFLFQNLSLIKRMCAFSLSTQFYSVLLRNSGVFENMLVIMGKNHLLIKTFILGEKGFHFLFPIPDSSVSPHSHPNQND